MRINSPSPTADAALLRWRTGDTSRHLMLGFAAAFAIATTTGLVLWLGIGHANLVQVLLITHLAAGALALIFFLPFVVIHWRDGREPLLHLVYPFRLLHEISSDPYARRRLIGHGLMWSMLLVLFSGLIVALPAIPYLLGNPLTLPYGGHVWLLRAHVWLSLPLIVLVVLHLPKADRK